MRCRKWERQIRKPSGIQKVLEVFREWAEVSVAQVEACADRVIQAARGQNMAGCWAGALKGGACFPGEVRNHWRLLSGGLTPQRSERKDLSGCRAPEGRQRGSWGKS